MDTKIIKKMTESFYEPWDQVMHVTKFAKHLEEQQEYLKSAGIKITDASKLQFYTEQIIDSQMFDKPIIIRWDKRSTNRKI